MPHEFSSIRSKLGEYNNKKSLDLLTQLLNRPGCFRFSFKVDEGKRGRAKINEIFGRSEFSPPFSPPVFLFKYLCGVRI